MLSGDPIEFNIKIRTQQSQEYSISNIDCSQLQGSLDSVCVPDDMLSYRIQCLQNQQALSARSTNSSVRSSHDNQKQLGQFRSMSSFQLLSRPFQFNSLSISAKHKILSLRKCPNLSHTQIHNRAFGAMFGLIIGDVLGAHVLNKKPNTQDIEKAMMMEGGGIMNLKSGEGTDQWELNVAVAEGLIDGKGKYNRNFMTNRYLQWIQSSPNDMPVVFGIALSQIRKQRKEMRRRGSHEKLGDQLLVDSLKNIKQESALGLIRLMPLVIWGLNLEDDEFQWLIKQQMKLIAPNPFAIQVTVLFARLLRTLISTGNIDEALKQTINRVWQTGSDKLLELWSMTEQYPEPMMHSGCASHIRFPFIFAIKELINLDVEAKDVKQNFAEIAGRILSKGFNTDTNCSIVLGLVGAALGYNNIPNYFREKVLKQDKNISKRSKNYRTGRVIQLVQTLLKQGPIFLDQ